MLAGIDLSDVDLRGAFDLAEALLVDDLTSGHAARASVREEVHRWLADPEGYMPPDDESVTTAGGRRSILREPPNPQTWGSSPQAARAQNAMMNLGKA